MARVRSPGSTSGQDLTPYVCNYIFDADKVLLLVFLCAGTHFERLTTSFVVGVTLNRLERFIRKTAKKASVDPVGFSAAA